ncbi:site-2 protease family protein [candidate division KSB1 bacterium]|nr:site-2 protease family protein [candidate division KSB1 bacterium]NIR71255.1 site-2 protease family protein [candidate division KSB1 bacterium]NIS24784.1 site-2 protease family protein [candidate division KSB1 bacterium]NIT71691.1 site-2 protease family protein [candidate division KSB1 bacterium]NIU25420.1 site-2 protease family protein [candidate division KSB1 bacterium]
MFGKSVRLFKLFGFEVKIDLSWLVLAVLITWSLAQGWFPHNYENFSPATYWWMGVAGAFGLFFSIVFHELSHSLVARQYGIPMRGITLFIFGGVAEMTEEPPSAKSEFMMAIAGPIASIVLAAAFIGINWIFGSVGEVAPGAAVVSYLALINMILAAFNLVPAFPLDGGRVLRSILWGWKNNLRKATYISSKIGSGFGLFLILLGVVWFIRGNFIGGVWQFLIGMFLRNASQMSYKQLLMRKALEGEQIEKFMKRDPVTVPSSLSLNELAEDYFYKYQHKMFPVVENDKVVGCVTIPQLKEFPRDEWNQHTVGEVAKNCTQENSITAESDPVKVLSTMKRTGNSRLMVLDNSHLVGVVALKDMLNFLSTKVDLEEET